MDTNDTLSLEEAILEAELEIWDWARTAGVSADDLREALRACLPGPELRTPA